MEKMEWEVKGKRQARGRDGREGRRTRGKVSSRVLIESSFLTGFLNNGIEI